MPLESEVLSEMLTGDASALAPGGDPACGLSDGEDDLLVVSFTSATVTTLSFSKVLIVEVPELPGSDIISFAELPGSCGVVS